MDRFMSVELIGTREGFLATGLWACIRSGACVGPELEETIQY